MAPGPMDRAGQRSSRPLAAQGIKVVAAPLPLTSFRDDVAALDRTLERVTGPIVLAGHAYAGAVIGATRNERVRALVYVAALAPDEGETVADVFYRAGTASAGAQARARRSWADLPARSGVRCRFRAACLGRRAGSPGGGSAADLVGVHHGRHRPAAVEGPSLMVPRGRGGPHDCSRDPAFHGGANEGARAIAPGRPYAARHRARDRRGYYSRGRG